MSKVWANYWVINVCISTIFWMYTSIHASGTWDRNFVTPRNLDILFLKVQSLCKTTTFCALDVRENKYFARGSQNERQKRTMIGRKSLLPPKVLVGGFVMLLCHYSCGDGAQRKMLAHENVRLCIRSATGPKTLRKASKMSKKRGFFKILIWTALKGGPLLGWAPLRGPAFGYPQISHRTEIEGGPL